MPSFLNAAHLKRLETEDAEIVVRASHSGTTLEQLIPERYIKILNPHCPSCRVQCLMHNSDFHSHKNSSRIYCWNAYERENQLSLPKEVEKH